MCVRGAYFSLPSVAPDKRAPARPDTCRDCMPSIANLDWYRAFRGVLMRWLSRGQRHAQRPSLRFRSGGDSPMKQIEVGIIGTGWCGGIRAHTCAANPLVKGLHLAEIRPERLAEVAAATNACTAVAEYHHLL